MTDEKYRKLPDNVRIEFRPLVFAASRWQRIVSQNRWKQVPIFIRSEYVLSPQSMIEIKMHMPGREAPVHVIGEVKFAEEGTPGGMGIDFFSMDNSTREDLVMIADRGQWHMAIEASNIK